MKNYIHWLKYDIRCGEKELQDIKNYCKTYPKAKVEVYLYKYSFNRAIKLICEQNYQDLDLDVNSMGTNLIRLTQKPKNIFEKGIDVKLWFDKVI